MHVISRESGKPAMANAATLLARQYRSSTHSAAQEFAVSQNEVNTILEGVLNRDPRIYQVLMQRIVGKYGFPSPDLMLVHNVLPHKRSKNVLELHGFPPWQIRLTEFQ